MKNWTVWQPLWHFLKCSCCSLPQVLAACRVELIACFCLHCPSPLDFIVAAHKRALEGWTLLKLHIYLLVCNRVFSLSLSLLFFLHKSCSVLYVYQRQGNVGSCVQDPRECSYLASDSDKFFRAQVRRVCSIWLLLPNYTLHTFVWLIRSSYVPMLSYCYCWLLFNGREHFRGAFSTNLQRTHLRQGMTFVTSCTEYF